MVAEILNYFWYQASYLLVFLAVLAYFLVLYFGMGRLFEKACRLLEKQNLLTKIEPVSASRKQTRYEVQQSLVSIFNFGLSGLAVVFLVRQNLVQLIPDSAMAVLSGLLILTLWNEVHFFLVHRLMHLPFFMRHVHYVHHRSRVPGVYSVFSFHPVESLLLSTVQLTIVPFISFSPATLFLFPVVSLLLNLAGHCNYRFGKGNSSFWLIFATRHNLHHQKNQQAYGFLTPVMDLFFNTKFRKK